MPTIHDLSHALTICMYADDHAPPHFHLKGPGQECEVRLSDLRMMAGRADRKDLSLAVAWAMDNMELLRRRWSELNERG